MIVRAGLEQSAELNKRLDDYVRLLIEHNAPLTFINYSDGRHSFDLVDDTERSREIIKETLRFLSNTYAPRELVFRRNFSHQEGG